MNTAAKKSCSLFDAAEQVTRTNPRTDSEWTAVIARVSHSSGWSVEALKGEIDRQYHAWCADHGYDYT